ncbi:ribosome biogenesis GTP-binding protein YihA/YsxC [Chishuiella sp.]|uniref:ribosome biogenesis GTP-binding protein YihA/YsxC n=1 Tax=Chishuiella sp. TaxID=1969467 RepID=UPI0028B066CC|nr:ribosome biogenesis GTP-binding protein YihA/YsxC [Chishuiella sp.]
MIKKAEFVKSSQKYKDCPPPNKPEYAFIGRSNVGKSSLINMIADKKTLAKTSATPGKTQLINTFEMDDVWYLADLPGYGFAKAPKGVRGGFNKMIYDYIEFRENLVNVFLLIDSRHEPQRIDLQFMEWLGNKQIPFSIVFTKLDKLTSTEMQKKLNHYKTELLKTWEELPQIFVSSSTSRVGKLEITNYIDSLNEQLKDKFNNKY